MLRQEVTNEDEHTSHEQSMNGDQPDLRVMLKSAVALNHLESVQDILKHPNFSEAIFFTEQPASVSRSSSCRPTLFHDLDFVKTLKPDVFRALLSSVHCTSNVVNAKDNVNEYVLFKIAKASDCMRALMDELFALDRFDRLLQMTTLNSIDSINVMVWLIYVENSFHTVNYMLTKCDYAQQKELIGSKIVEGITLFHIVASGTLGGEDTALKFLMRKYEHCITSDLFSAKDEKGRTVLHFALPSIANLKLLIHHPLCTKELFHASSEDEGTILDCAASDPALVKQFIQLLNHPFCDAGYEQYITAELYGARYRAEQNKTILHLAAAYPKALKLLLRDRGLYKREFFEARDRNDDTLLHHARYTIPSLELLLEHEYCSPLLMTMKNKQHVCLLDNLLTQTNEARATWKVLLASKHCTATLLEEKLNSSPQFSSNVGNHLERNNLNNAIRYFSSAIAKHVRPPYWFEQHKKEVLVNQNNHPVTNKQTRQLLAEFAAAIKHIGPGLINRPLTDIVHVYRAVRAVHDKFVLNKPLPESDMLERVNKVATLAPFPGYPERRFLAVLGALLAVVVAGSAVTVGVMALGVTIPYVSAALEISKDIVLACCAFGLVTPGAIYAARQFGQFAHRCKEVPSGAIAQMGVSLVNARPI